MNHVAEDIGQSEVAASVAVGEFFVIDAQQVEQRCVKVVDVYFATLGIKAVLIGGSMAGAPFDATTGGSRGEGSKSASSRRARTKRSIGFFTHALLSTSGSEGFSTGRRAQCVTPSPLSVGRAVSRIRQAIASRQIIVGPYRHNAGKIFIGTTTIVLDVHS